MVYIDSHVTTSLKTASTYVTASLKSHVTKYNILHKDNIKENSLFGVIKLITNSLVMLRYRLSAFDDVSMSWNNWSSSKVSTIG